jgi:hypothetical protein
MERKEAKAVLELLAKGISPETGEMVAQESPFNEPRVIRALYLAIGLFGPSEEPVVRAKAVVRTKDLPEQAGKPWTPDEDKRLLDSFDAGMNPRKLAEMHGRSRGAIGSRLAKLGRVTKD